MKKNILVVNGGSADFAARIKMAFIIIFGVEAPRIVETNSIDGAFELCATGVNEGHPIDSLIGRIPSHDCSKIDLLMISGLNNIDLLSLIENFKRFGFDGKIFYLVDDDINPNISESLVRAGVDDILLRPTVDDIEYSLRRAFSQKPLIP